MKERKFRKKPDLGELKRKAAAFREKWKSGNQSNSGKFDWRKYVRVRYLGIVCLAVLPAAVAVWLAGEGERRRGEEASSRIAESESLRVIKESESIRAWKENMIASVAGSVEESIAESEAEAGRGPELTEEQAELLTGIADALSDGQMEACARMMEERGDELAEIFYDVMGGQDYLYRDGVLYTELEGSGLVLRKSSLAFYGDFAHGRPDGTVTALQAIDLDYPRYDYAVGTWHDGAMYGYGTVGYSYYEGSGQDNQMVRREGLFLDNLMYGEILYETANAQGETGTWNITALNGILVLDDRWMLDKAGEFYQLRSNESDGHAYVIPADSAEEVRFQNLLLWE